MSNKKKDHLFPLHEAIIIKNNPKPPSHSSKVKTPETKAVISENSKSKNDIKVAPPSHSSKVKTPKSKAVISENSKSKDDIKVDTVNKSILVNQKTEKGKFKSGPKSLSESQKERYLEVKHEFLMAVKKRNHLPNSASCSAKQIQSVLRANGVSKANSTPSAVNHCFSGKTARVPTKAMYSAMLNAIGKNENKGKKGQLLFQETIAQKAEAEASKLLFKQELDKIIGRGADPDCTQAPDATEKPSTSKNIQKSLNNFCKPVTKSKSYSHAFTAHMALVICQNDQVENLEELVEEEFFKILNTNLGGKLMRVSPEDFDAQNIIEKSKSLIKMFDSTDGV